MRRTSHYAAALGVEQEAYGTAKDAGWWGSGTALDWGRSG
jgi:hypothetical protein